MKPVVGYTRVSGKGQLDGTGLDRQEESIRAFCKAQGFELGRIYQEAFTGTDADRPEFLQMLEDLLSNGCRTIIVESLDRLARDLSVQLQIIAILNAKGLTLYSANTGSNVTEAMLNDPMNKAMIQIQGVFAELDKSLIVRKLKKARESVRAQQGRCEGRKPFGYYPGESEIVAQIKRLARKPRGGEPMKPQEIANQLNREKVPTRTGAPWSAKMIKNILNCK